MIIQKLLLLESQAQEAMRTIEKEQFIWHKKAENDLARRMTQLEYEKDAAIAQMAQAAEHEAAQIIAKMQADYKQKGSELTTAFAENRDKWVDKITHDIFYGEST